MTARQPRTRDVRRVSTAMLKVELGPTRWRATSRVHLECEGYAADVRVVDVPCATSHGSHRRFLECPRCGSTRATVLGVVPGVGWCCRLCGRWRGHAAPRIRPSNIEPPSGSTYRAGAASRPVGTSFTGVNDPSSLA
jgi:hypothetical protein